MRTDEQRRKAVAYLNRHPEQREKQRARAIEAIRKKRAADPATQRKLALYRELTADGEVCAICGELPGQRRHSIDHDHVTDEIRGILCHRCNLMLGNARDSVAILAAGIEYLSRGAYTGISFAEALSMREDAA